MNSLVGEDRQKLKKLYEAGCCIKCSLYLINFPTFDIFLKKSINITKAFSFEPHDNTCVSCLGIFQDFLMFEELPRLTKVKIENIEHENFLVSIYCPHSIVLRHLALLKLIGASWTDKSSIYEKFKNTVKYLTKKVLALELGVKFATTSGLDIILRFTHSESENEHKMFIVTGSEPPAKKKKNETDATPNPEQLRIIEQAVSKKKLSNFESFVPPPVPKTLASLEVVYLNSPFYVTGNYCKFERGISQTEWFVNDERIGDNSVGEIIAEPFIDLIKASSFNFHSSGREDIDVRMLGKGRPFVIEFFNPSKYSIPDEVLAEVERKINQSSVTNINSLKIADASIMHTIEEGASEKKKEYQCVIWTSKILKESDIYLLNSIRDLKVGQKTPIRVLQRRALDVRDRTIHSFHATKVNDHFCVLNLTTQAGTYIKEFVHGDLGRTSPSMCTILGCDVDIIQLDVINLIFDEKK